MSSPPSTIADPSHVPLAPGAAAVIALGANLPSRYGAPAATLREAIRRLASWSGIPLLQSSIWISEPVDCEPATPEFANAVVMLLPDRPVSAAALLERLLALEEEFGRHRPAGTNAPRPLDLDLVSFGDTRFQTAALVLPHPAAHARGFVLLPLAEIAPGLRLPGQALTVRELADALPATAKALYRIDD